MTVAKPTPDEVLEYLRSKSGRPLKAKELARGLGVSQADYHDFKALLKRLEDEGTLYRVQRQRYAVPEKINLVVGRLQTIRSGAGFVVPEAGRDDVYVPGDALESAVDGDRVVARVERRKRGQRTEGRIIKVLERARSTIVGVYHPGRNLGYVVPEDSRLKSDVFIAPGQEAGATDGDIVVVRISDWGRSHRGPAGVVERVLGRRDMPGVDVLAVLYGHELPIDFSADVSAEADALATKGITGADRAGREDLTDTLVFTIDPADAKDHDDALSIRRVGEGLWEVGVHIADVSHYVREGTALDGEALARGTSVYLVDRVVPMLPHALSSNLCSLRPDEDRLTLSLMLALTDEGEVRDQRLVRGVIRSRHKLSYDMVQSVLDRTLSIDAETDEALRSLAAIARSLRQARSRRGSIDFDLPEARVVLDSSGAPIDIQRVQRFESHRLIEDFMLLANETIAAGAAKAKVPFIYRVHEAPDEAKIEALAAFAATFGYRLKTRGDIGPADLQRVLDQARGRPEEGLLSMIVLRSMKQARYSTENLGHFGLAARSYTHFTSPIRRYPDLIVHRIAGSLFIDGGRPDRTTGDALEAVAKLSSERERVAVSAERESVDLKKAEFMERHLGDDFDGTISSVTSFGFFVLLDAFFVEGLVHVSSLEDDYYMYVEDQYMLVGEHTRRQFRLGDRVRVQVVKVDREENRIDFIVLAQPGRKDGRGSRRRTRKRS